MLSCILLTKKNNLQKVIGPLMSYEIPEELLSEYEVYDEEVFKLLYPDLYQQAVNEDLFLSIGTWLSKSEIAFVIEDDILFTDEFAVQYIEDENKLVIRLCMNCCAVKIAKFLSLLFARLDRNMHVIIDEYSLLMPNNPCLN